MLSPNLIEEIKIHMVNIDFCSLGGEWWYDNVVSPFSRIYLITKGEGYIMLHNELKKLKPGYLYLIPSFTLCSYQCLDSMEQYYLHFKHELPDGLKLFNRLNFIFEVKASELDKQLFERILAINPGMQLRHSDPNLFKDSYWKETKKYKGTNTHQLETIGVIKQLLSRFINSSSNSSIDTKDKLWVEDVILYIKQHLDCPITIGELANIACFSNDHFTRQFKKTTGLKPLEFINSKRIEKAQELLITTRFSQKSISELCGFNSVHYYNRVFKQIVGLGPAEYRRMGGCISV